MVLARLGEFAANRVRYAISPSQPLDENPTADMISEETGLDVEEATEAEIVGLTDSEGDRLVTTDSTGVYNAIVGDEYSFDAGDAADQVGDDVGERAGDIWEFIPTWGWAVGVLVVLAAGFTYTRPLWSIVGGVASG